MKKSLILTMLLLVFVLVGCAKESSTTASKSVAGSKKGSTTTESATTQDDKTTFDIRFIENIPTINPYSNFDVMNVIVPFEGAEYSFSGMYVGSRNKEYNITFNKSVFNIPQDGTVAEITVTATYEGETKEKNVNIPILGTPDVIDQAFYELWHEESITGALNYNPQFVKDQVSSIKYKFSGYYFHGGIQFGCLNAHFSNKGDTECYDKNYLSIYKEDDVEEAFKDAYVILWVYNAMDDQTETGYDDSLYFGLRYRQSENLGLVDYDWGQTNILKVKRGEWTLVYWSLKDLGKTTDLYKDLDTYYQEGIADSVYRNSYDSVYFKVNGYNIPKNESQWDTGTKYTYTFYADGYDLVSKAQFDKLCETATLGEIVSKP